MRKIVILLALILLVAAPAARCADDIYTVHLDRELLNGKGWQQMGSSVKMSYMHGLFDGAFAFMLINSDLLPGADKPWTKFVADRKETYKDTIDAIDSFYKDAGNARIPVIFAYVHHLMQGKGLKQEMIDEYVGKRLKEFDK